MTGGQKDTSSSLPYPDDMTGSGSAENAILANQELLDSVCSTNLGDELCDLGIPVATVTTDNEESSLDAFRDGLKNAGNECLGVVLLLEDLDFLTETRTAGVEN